MLLNKLDNYLLFAAKDAFCLFYKYLFRQCTVLSFHYLISFATRKAFLIQPSSDPDPDQIKG